MPPSGGARREDDRQLDTGARIKLDRQVESTQRKAAPLCRFAGDLERFVTGVDQRVEIRFRTANYDAPEPMGARLTS